MRNRIRKTHMWPGKMLTYLRHLGNATLDDMIQLCVEVLGDQFHKQCASRWTVLRGLDHSGISTGNCANLWSVVRWIA